MQAAAEVEAVVAEVAAEAAVEAAATVAAAVAEAVLAEAADADSTAERARASTALLEMRPERTQAQARSLAVQLGPSSALQQPQELQQVPGPNDPVPELAAGGECRRDRSAGMTVRLLQPEGAQSTAAVAAVAVRSPPAAV